MMGGMGGAKGGKGAKTAAPAAQASVCTSPEFAKAKECLSKACSAEDAGKIYKLLGATC